MSRSGIRLRYLPRLRLLMTSAVKGRSKAEAEALFERSLSPGN
jgi:hypothetical protein